MKKPDFKVINASTIYRKIIFLLIFNLLALSCFSQVAMTWTGAISTDANDTNNWSPKVDFRNNNLTIPRISAVPFQPVFSDSTNATIASVTTFDTSSFTVSMTKNAVLTVNNNNWWVEGKINVTSGKLKVRNSRSLYLDNYRDTLNISGTGIVECNLFLLVGVSGLNDGGRINISGDGQLNSLNYIPDRFCTSDLNRSVISITDNGKMTVPGNWFTSGSKTIPQLIATNQLRTTAGREIAATYDAGLNKTTVYSRDASQLYTTITAKQQAVVNTPAENTIRLDTNTRYKEIVSFEWKWTATSGSGYQSFTPAQTGDTCAPTFPQTGTVYLVCVGKDATNDSTYSNEVEYNVVSNRVSVSPGTSQLLQLNQSGYPLTVIEDSIIDSRQWMISTTSGSGFIAIPGKTDSVYVPAFDSVFTYYVLCSSVIGGVEYRSKEVVFEVVANGTIRDITWTGEYSTDADDMRNWVPMAHTYKNILHIDSTGVDCIFSISGNTSIRSVSPAKGAKFIVNMANTDTLHMEMELAYYSGEFAIESGVVTATGYTRIEDPNAVFRMTGGKYISDNVFFPGNKDGNKGAQFYLSGKAVLEVPTFDRWCNTDTTQSVFHLSDTATIIINSNYVDAFIYRRDVKGQFLTGTGFYVNYEYNDADVITTIYVSLPPLELANNSSQILGVDETGSELTTVNKKDFTSFEWKYSTTSGSDYASFDPAVTTEAFSPSFHAADTYYVVCEGTNGTLTETTSEAEIIVVSVIIAPADTQRIFVATPGTDLTVSESTTASSRTWKYSATSGSGYSLFSTAQNDTAFSPIFDAAGTYYVVCESVFETKHIISNEVVIIVDEEQGVSNMLLSGNIRLYPNPSAGEINIYVKGYDNYTVKVIDLQGKIVYEKSYKGVSGAQSLKIQNSGVYQLQIITKDGIVSRKVIVQ
ncbi:MAG: T9SS type A sorting domain-containing protein [Bacteroidales bacterium]|nr:T9SS type A sorting domain-containing protein [Bacteroidales bacterium]